MTARVCRVAPDVPAVDRTFDYLVGDELAARIEVGSVVRVPLHGRSVRGWVLEADVEPRTDRLERVARVSSVGPDAAMVDLCRWAARRWAGPLVAFLRSATPVNTVGVRPPRGDADRPTRAALSLSPSPLTEVASTAAREVASQGSTVVRWPPLADRRPLIAALLPAAGSVIIASADAHRAEGLATWLRGAGMDVVLDRADLAAAQRTTAWTRSASGSVVVVGGRVTAFAPVPDLALVIVVDDGDESLQSERTPTWSAREVLVERARRASVPAILIDATPSVSAIFAARARVSTPTSFERTHWPVVEVVDRRSEPPGAGLFGEPIAAILRLAVSAGRPALVVVNRRGRARLLVCSACGTLQRWDASGRPLWEDGSGDPVLESLDRPSICPSCGATSLKLLRAGVSRLREDLEALLPRARVVDVEASSGPVARLDDADVIVGTEAVLHRHELRRRRPARVVFADFDSELMAQRFAAPEQALRLLRRGARMLDTSPRRDSRLVIQTRQPEHPVVSAVAAGEPGTAIEAELARRRTLELPPFRVFAELRGDDAAVSEAVRLLSGLDHRADGVRVVGPTTGERGGAAALVSADDHDHLAAALADVLAQARSHGRIRAAVDPPRI